MVFSRDTDHGPISETRIEELKPCIEKDLVRISNPSMYVDGFEETVFVEDCQVDERWQEFSDFTITEYDLARSSNLLDQLLVHFNLSDISAYDNLEVVYEARDLKLWTRSTTIWNPEC